LPGVFHAGEYQQAYRHPEGKRYCPVVLGPTGRIKPDWVMVNDRQEKHPEGAYYLDRNEDGKRRRMSVGNDAASAYNRRARKQRELDAIAAGHHARLSSVFAPTSAIRTPKTWIRSI
jgi:hypothetical protein